MEITKDNWSLRNINNIVDDIKKSEYIAIDTELTGIDINSKSFFDSLEDRYIKLAKTSNTYNIMQLGICCFTKDDKKLNTFNCKPYNIYIFPQCSDSRIHLEISAIYFNSSNNFDFNKWINKGVEYLNTEGVEKERQYLTEKNLNMFKATSPITLYKDDDKKKYNEILSEIEKFVSNQESNMIVIQKPHKFILYYLVENLKPTIKNSIYFEEGEIESKENNTIKQVLYVHKVKNHKEKEELIKKYIEYQIPKILEVKKGAKVIFDALIEQKQAKIIGHNCTLDYMFLITHFLEHLPINAKNSKNEYEKFKSMMTNLFPNLYDSKYVFKHYSKLKNIILKGNNLESVYKNLVESNNQSKNPIKFNLSFNNDYDNRYENSSIESYHEAAFDAYVTGISFILMENNSESKFIKDMKGKLYVMQGLYESMDIYSSEDKFDFNSSYNFYGILMKDGLGLSDVNFKDLLEIVDKDKRLVKIFKENQLKAMILIVNWNKPNSSSLNLLFNNEMQKLQHSIIEDEKGNKIKKQSFEIFSSFDSLLKGIKEKENIN